MASLQGAPAPRSRAVPSTASSKTRSRLEELEGALALARADRGRHLEAVEDELVQLQRIYERMSNDLEALRLERDRAIEEAQVERERRARETLDLSEQLDSALRGAAEARDAPASPEAFVLARLRAAPADHKPLAPGELPTVPGYRIVSILGQGGMATVYQGVTERDGQEVAVKLLHDGLEASPGRVELFLREAAVMLQLSHPGLVGALDAGDCAYGRFLVLELVRGESLAGFVRRTGPLPEKEAIRVGLQVARALSYCARLGLTHRDVKPSNLLMDASGRVRLCDFGLAALSYGADPARPYGSPGYAAPEQITQPTAVDERVDIYALGATLWHLVVGRRPFQGSPKQVFEAQRSQDVSDPRFEGADISPRLAQVIRRMGRSQRDRRYRRWDECILDLMLVENGNPPFSAHLAEALEPGPSPTGSPDAGAEPANPPRVEPAAPSPAIAECAEIPRAPVQSLAPKSLRDHAGWVLVFATCVLGAAIGYGISAASRGSPADEIEMRAMRLVQEGHPEQAASSLRAAAGLLEGESRDRLVRLAERLETR